MDNFVIRVSDPAEPKIGQLLERLNQYLMELYPPEVNYIPSLESLRQPNVTFLAACLQEEVIGCGALIDQQGKYGEIKRLFVKPEFRRLKIGDRLLASLEKSAISLNLPWIRLETGILQPEALRLYEKRGYQPCPPFDCYKEDPLSVFLQKQLLRS
ncbi:GNAT family N-acetyltransferase [Spirulina subsalsa FACHB-351]|uniref:GNAT family N-acetyltransferase n=1 Tax=Spirulina subsalsa FACHB-351 TaxID=234711 RepID=A0ABT3L379_9CYAN|nr:GNAT family N-acetyltransferase [Spirulina subsalsa]MCW6035440.1 GNAT family N-acetyltransferase [Spirulina subsalsa FACHB-351]